MKWTNEEIEILKDNYATLSHKDLCRALPGRSWCTIQVNASKLKLRFLGTYEERFWKHVDKNQENGCWNWTGTRRRGYGQIWRNKETIKAHRFSWVLHNGKIPEDKPFVLHRCDNPSCVNPNHLWVGTHQDNMNDKVNKNRQIKGEEIEQSKLTENQIKEIRRLCCEEKLSQSEIAKIFDVSQPLISSIYRNKTWKHVI